MCEQINLDISFTLVSNAHSLFRARADANGLHVAPRSAQSAAALEMQQPPAASLFSRRGHWAQFALHLRYC